MKAALFGSEGRMGRLLRQEAGTLISAAYDIHPPGLPADTPLPPGTDVVIDFSSPGAWGDLDRLLSQSDAALVTGTTGLTDECSAYLNSWVAARPVFMASNMSRGIYVLGRLLAEAAGMLADDFDLEIVEFHHGGKVDSPSGTALSLLDIWLENGGGSKVTHGRSGAAGPRDSDEIGVHSVRGGDVAGDHQLHLLGTGERLTLSHSATSRMTFVAGALKAAEFIIGKPPGLYSMDDLMGRGKRR